MKIAALIDRSKPRDLYDTDYLFKNLQDMDQEMLRKASIFYLSLDSVYKIEQATFKGIKGMSSIAIKKELFPVLKNGEKFNLSEAQEKVIQNLSNLVSLNEPECLYLAEFSKGNFEPSLLFDNSVVERAEKHPMAKWRVLNIKND